MSERWIAELTRQGAQFADGRIASFGHGAEAGFAAQRDSAVLCDLSHLSLMLASGDEAAKFLHGQFCNDVLALGEGDAQWNGWCSPKGRLLVTCLAWLERKGIYMLLPASLQPAIHTKTININFHIKYLSENSIAVSLVQISFFFYLECIYVEMYFIKIVNFI